jgi:hypothetical protein
MLRAMIVIQALGFPTPNNPFARKWAVSRSDDGALPLTIATVIVNDNPIRGLIQLVGSWRV